MTDGEPKRILVGVFSEGLPSVLIIPRDGLKPAEVKLDAERERLAGERRTRERLASEARLQVMQSARAQGKLRKALHTILRRGRRR